MTYFAAIPHSEPIRVALIGAGSMGRNWLRLLSDDSSVELVGIVDLDLVTAQEAAASVDRADLVVARSLDVLIASTRVEAVVNVTVPGAHHVINLEALALGLAVLCEKPVVPTVAQALDLAAAAQVSGRLLMTSQSRRYYRTLDEFKLAVGGLGRIGLLSCEFHTGPHFGGFRDEMDHPLLLDMAIHAFDCARFVLGSQPVSVYCDEFNPSWSWYDGDAATVTVFEMSDGTRFVYTGSWCNQGQPTSWNGAWTARGARGAASWDGSSSPSVDITAPTPEAAGAVSGSESSTRPEEIAGALQEFVSALRSGRTPYGDIHSNVWSLAMVESAVASAESRARVQTDQLVEAAYVEALAKASSPEVAVRLASWGNSKAGLSAFA
jgi:predicted dehydrogenase